MPCFKHSKINKKITLMKLVVIKPMYKNETNENKRNKKKTREKSIFYLYFII